MPYNNLTLITNFWATTKNHKHFHKSKKPSTKFTLSTVISFCGTKVGRFCCTWAWTWVASLKRKASLRPRKVCGCRSLERGGSSVWERMLRRCGPGWAKLNQCQCIDLFSKAEGSNEMDQKFPKSLTSNEKLPFRRSLFWDAPLRMISMSDQTRIPKSFASYYLPKWALSSTTAIASQPPTEATKLSKLTPLPVLINCFLKHTEWCCKINRKCGTWS